MGDKASSTDARGLRAQLAGLNSAEQQNISNSRFATDDEIREYMNRIGFNQMDEEGYFENDMYILSDIKPKNVLCIDGDMYVIDAEISRK